MKSLIFKQITQAISYYQVHKIAKKYQGDRYSKVFSSWNHLMVMLYAQLSGRTSLRDIINSLQSSARSLYHIGIGRISLNNLSHQNRKRDYRIFRDLYYVLSHKFANTFNMGKRKKFKFKKELKSIDSTTVSLCKQLYEWAKFRETKAGIKMHTVLNHQSQLPDFIAVTEAKVNDAKGVMQIPISENSIYVVDRAYLSLKWLYSIIRKDSHFVIRLKTNTKYKIIKRNKVNETNKKKGIKFDYEIKFTGNKKDDYPKSLRLIKYKCPTTGETYEYITDNFNLSPFTIAEIYKDRWSIELFFKKIKQNLRIKRFFGLSENAVLIQIWTAMIAVLIYEWCKKISRANIGLKEFLTRIQPNLFSKKHFVQVLHAKGPPKINKNVIQLELF